MLDLSSTPTTLSVLFFSIIAERKNLPRILHPLIQIFEEKKKFRKKMNEFEPTKEGLYTSKIIGLFVRWNGSLERERKRISEEKKKFKSPIDPNHFTFFSSSIHRGSGHRQSKNIKLNSKLDALSKFSSSVW